MNQPSGEIPKFKIVCLAGSAGAYGAYREFLRSLPEDTGMAFVIVSGRGSQSTPLQLPFLACETTMRVVEVEDGMRLEPNSVFITPPHMEVRTNGTTLHLRPLSRPKAWPALINVFLRSLSMTGSRAVAVILSGMAYDVGEALAAIKAGGGVTFGQSGAVPETTDMSPAEIAKALTC